MSETAETETPQTSIEAEEHKESSYEIPTTSSNSSKMQTPSEEPTRSPRRTLKSKSIRFVLPWGRGGGGSSFFLEHTELTVGDAIAPKVIASSGQYEQDGPENLLDDQFDTRWNAGHLSGWDDANWVVFDFEQSVRVTEFALRSCGDNKHDPKVFHLQTSDSPSNASSWKTVATFEARTGITAWQAFTLSGVSRYWRLNIETRATRFQTYMTGVRFRTSLGELFMDPPIRT